MPPLSPLETLYIDGRKFRLTHPFQFQTEQFGVITVPEGFETDFASIPRVLWNILPPTGGYGEAAVVHDYIYVMGGRLPDYPEHTFTKKEADNIFLDAMKDLKVNWFQRHTMYIAVRWFGRGSF